MKSILVVCFLFSFNLFAQNSSPIFSVDGESFFVSKIEGGNVLAQLLEQNSGSILPNKKQISTTKIENIQLGLFVPAFKKFNDIVNGMMSGSPLRFNGLLASDLNGKFVVDKEFKDGFVTEVVIPELDAASKDQFVISMSIAPDTVNLRPASATAPRPSGVSGSRSAQLSSNFRFEVDGISRLPVSKISSIILTQKPNLVPGRGSRNSIEPGKLSISNFEIILFESQATELLAWYEDFVLKGKNSDADEKNGRIVMLDSSMSKETTVFELGNLGIISYQVLAEQRSSVANASSIRKVKVGLYVERLTVR